MSNHDDWLEDLSNNIKSEGSNEYLFNRILQTSIKQEAIANSSSDTGGDNEISKQILIKTCPYLFSSSSQKGDNQLSSVHPKFKKLYQKLTRYIQRKLEKKSEKEEIENHIRKMMDNLMWNNGEVVDFFHDQDEWLQSNTQYSSLKSGTLNASTPSNSSTGRIDSNQNMDLIWEQLKTEVFEILLNVMGETSITLYEFKHALRTALYQLQLKEREYRRIPKELLEIAIDKFLPNAQNGRSLVQFIVSELKRLKSETENISSELKNINTQDGNQSTSVQQPEGSTSKRLLKIISMTIMQLLQRRLIPIPGIQMLDDEISNNTVGHLEKPINRRANKRIHYKGIVDFSKKVYLNYLQNKRSNERKKDFSVTMDDTQLQSNNNNNSLSYWNNSTFSSRINNIGRSSTMSREIDNWMNQYRDIVGAINIHIPLYKDPKKLVQKKEEEIKQKEKELQYRIKHLEKLESVWELTEHKQVVSEMVSKMLLKKLEYYKHKKYQHLLEKSVLKPHLDSNEYILPENLSTEFKNMFVDRVKVKLSNMELESFLERRDEIPKMLGENLKLSYPSFLKTIETITKHDIETFRDLNSIERHHMEQIQIRSFQFLKAMKEEIGEVSFSKFQHLISSEGPLHNLSIVQSLLKKANQYIETNISYKDILPYLTKSDIELESSTLLFEWIFKGNHDEEKLKELLELKSVKGKHTIQILIEKISNYVLNSELDENVDSSQLFYIPYKWEERIEIIRDYCITNILKHKSSKENDGEHFVLNYVASLQDTLEYESFYTDNSDMSGNISQTIDSQFEEERQQVMRKAAFKHIETVVCKTDEEKEWFKNKVETYHKKKATLEQEKRKNQTKEFLRNTGVIQAEFSFKSKVQKEMDKFERYQNRLTQDEEYKLLQNQFELETKGKAISNRNYDRHITEQRRRILFE